MGTILNTVFARSLSDFTCKLKLFMIKGVTLLILGHGVKFQGQLWPPARGCHGLRCLVLNIGIGNVGYIPCIALACVEMTTETEYKL